MTKSLLTLALTLPLTLTACAKSSVYRSADSFTPTDTEQFDDEAIRQAFSSSPQQHLPARVAVYSFDGDRAAEVLERVSALPGVESVYPLPDFLITGQRRFEADPYTTPDPPQIHQLRLLAAQAHCDLLLVADYGWKQDVRANGLAALNALLLPALFSPFLEVELTSYLDTYLLDVRNGYLYGAVTATEETLDQRATIYAVDDPEARDAQWTALLAETDQGLAALLAPAL
jgi:hypothetical protein